jgi:hypothetical protein
MTNSYFFGDAEHHFIQGDHPIASQKSFSQSDKKDTDYSCHLVMHVFAVWTCSIVDKAIAYAHYKFSPISPQ